MDKNGRRRTKTVKIDQKLSKTPKNGQRRTKTVKKGSKYVKISQNGRKRSKSIESGRNRSKSVEISGNRSRTVENGKNQSKAYENGRNLSKMVENGQNGRKRSKRSKSVEKCQNDDGSSICFLFSYEPDTMCRTTLRPALSSSKRSRPDIPPDTLTKHLRYTDFIRPTSWWGHTWGEANACLFLVCRDILSSTTEGIDKASRKPVPRTMTEMMKRVDDFVKSDESYKSTELPKGEHPEKGQGTSYMGSRPPLAGHGGRHQRTDNYNTYGRRDHYQPYVPPRAHNQRHYTNDCYQLKRQLVAALEFRKLSHLVKDVRQRGNNRGRQQRNNNTNGKIINMVRV
nr:hypothetical protein [Tanacetum cinerariifolium]